MDTAAIWDLAQGSLYMIIVFGVFLVYSIAMGRQSITNLILGLYFALLISIEFPYYGLIQGGTSDKHIESILMVVVFVVFTVISTILFARLMPREYSEKKFESFWQKLLLTAGATILVMSFSFHALPVTDLITPGSQIQYLFGADNSFFYWLLAPIVILFLT